MRIKEADELLKEKNFTEAKALYEKALKLIPNEAYPKNQLEKIDSIIADIDTLYKSKFGK
jgi:hypothetical protein